MHLPDLDHAGQDDIPVAELVTVVQWATYRRQHARPFSFFFPELRLDMEWVDGLRGGGGGGGGGEEAAGERTEGEGEEDLDPPPQETSPMSASNANTTPEGD